MSTRPPINLAPLVLANPSLHRAVCKADEGDVLSMYEVLTILDLTTADAKCQWHAFTVLKNGQVVAYVWGQDRVDALTRWIPSTMASEWQSGCEHTGTPTWDSTDVMDVTLAPVRVVVDELAPHRGRAFLVRGWIALMVARGKTVPDGFCRNILSLGQIKQPTGE